MIFLSSLTLVLLILSFMCVFDQISKYLQIKISVGKREIFALRYVKEYHLRHYCYALCVTMTTILIFSLT